jgi:predicted acyl esterase
MKPNIVLGTIVIFGFTGLMIRSELFPTFARNLNTGEPIKDATRVVVAQQQIYHDVKRPSALRFRQLNR